MNTLATRVVIYTADFWPVIGGVQSVVLELARGFAAQEPTAGAAECIVVTKTPAAAGLDSHLPFRVIRKPGIIELARLLWRCDVIHIAGPALWPLALGLLLRKRVVVEHHGFHTVCPNGLLFHEPSRAACTGHFLAGHHRECWKCNAGLGWWLSVRLWVLTFIRRWSCHFVAANIAPTQWLERLLQLPRTVFIRHGVADRPVCPLPSMNSVKFAFVGRLVSTKSVDLLLQAARQLLNKGLEFQLLITGDGPERKNLQQLSTHLGLEHRTVFAGQLEDLEMEAVLSSAIAVVMPSSAGEVFGLTIAESMMRGRTVIVPQNGPAAEIAGEAGLKFVAGDAQSLATCMEELIKSPQIAVALGDRARRQAFTNLSNTKMRDAHLAVYRELLK